MNHIDVRVVRVGDPAPFPDLAEKTIRQGTVDRFTVLEQGTTGGRASVGIFATLPDGSIAFIETTARLFEMMAGAARGACQSWGEDNT